MKPNQQSARERGASLVEFALVLPLFLLLIGGMVDLGRAFYTEVMLTNAAREGARSAMYSTTADNADARATAALANGVKDPSISVTPCAQNAGSDATATVTVSAPFHWILLGPAMNLVSAGTTSLPGHLSGEATMQCGG